MYLQTLCFPCDTCCFSQSISTILCSLFASCDAFDVVCLKSFLYHKRKLSLWPCYQAKIFLLYCLTSFWISCSFFSIYFVCTCFFGEYFRDVVHLETYTHERWYLPIWYPLYILCVEVMLSTIHHLRPCWCLMLIFILCHGMILFICKCCASIISLYKTSLLQMWVSWDECISWEYIKSCKWSINPKYVNLAIILHIFSSTKSHVQYWWNCKFSSLFLYPFLMILVAFFNAFQLPLVPLVIVVMYLMCLCLKFIQYTIR